MCCNCCCKPDSFCCPNDGTWFIKTTMIIIGMGLMGLTIFCAYDVLQLLVFSQLLM